MDTTDSTPGTSMAGTSARAGSLTLTVWPDKPWGEHQRYAYTVTDASTGRSVRGRDLFTGAGAPVEPGRALRELAGFLAASGEARQYTIDNPGSTPENAGLFPEPIAEAAQVNLDALTLLAEHGPQPDQPGGEPARRWVSVVFLQGDEADQVLDLLVRDGADAAIGHLAGYDYGEETTQAALENGYVYDTPPAGALDRTATDADGRYTLVYNPFLDHISLLRAYDAAPDPALLAADSPAREHGTRPRPAGQTKPGSAATDWFASPTMTPPAGRGLSL